MISFETKDDKEILNIQEIDIKFIIRNYPAETLDLYFENDEETLKFFRTVTDQTNITHPKYRESVLRLSFIIELNDGCLKEFFEELQHEHILFDRDRLLNIPEYVLDDVINQGHKAQETFNPSENNPYNDYVLDSYKFAKHVIEQKAKYDEIMHLADTRWTEELAERVIVDQAGLCDVVITDLTGTEETSLTCEEIKAVIEPIQNYFIRTGVGRYEPKDKKPEHKTEFIK